MSIKKIASLVTATAILMTAAVGCGTPAASSTTSTPANQSGAAPSTPASQSTLPEAATVSIMMSEHASYPINTDKQEVFQWIKDATNITIQVEVVPGSNYNEKKNTLLATNTMPDVMNVTQDDLNNYGRKGAFLNLSASMDKLPNFKEKFDRIPDLKSLTIDGKLYCFPKLCMGEQYGGSVPMIRTDLLEKLNLETPKTFDDLYNVLKEIKKNYPDSYPWVGRGLGSVLNPVAAGFGTFQNIGYDFGQNKWMHGTIRPEMKEALTYLNKLYAEGLLDPDFVTNTNQIMTERINSSKAVFYIDNAGVFAESCNATLAAQDPNAIMEMIPFPEKTPGTMNARVNNDQELLWGLYAASSKIKNPDAIFRLFDWMYSDEGAITTNWGKEGVSYEMINGRPEYVDAITTLPADKSADILNNQYGLTHNVAGVMVDKRLWQGAATKGYANGPAVKRSQMLKKLLDANPNVVQIPALNPPLNPEETEKVKEINTRISTIVEQSVVKFIIGSTPLSEFDAFVQKVESAGVRELETIYNDAAARLK